MDTLTNETTWYNNSIEVTSLRNVTIVGSANISINQNWSCSARFFDGTQYSSWLNSSTVTVGDLSAPSLLVGTLGASFLTTDTIRITANCSDLLSGIQYVRFADTFDNLNRTMTLDTGSLYQFNLTFASGAHNLSKFWCADSSGNINETNANLVFDVTTPGSSGSSPGGGGGGSTPVLGGSKVICNLQVFPNPVIFDKGARVVSVRLSNLENFSLAPAYTLNDSNTIILKTQSVPILPGGQTAELSLVKNYENFTTNNLIITSQECKDINIPIMQSIPEVQLTLRERIKNQLMLRLGKFDFFGYTLSLYFYYLIIFSAVVAGGISYLSTDVNKFGKIARTLLIFIIFSFLSFIFVDLVGVA